MRLRSTPQSLSEGCLFTMKIKVTVVLPAYNAALTLEKTLADLPMDYVDDIILVDDKSKDSTILVAQSLVATYPKLYVFAREKNSGYGANQKDCYEIALKRGADIIVMVHPDFQYDPRLVKHFVEFIREDYFDVVLGSRIRTRREALAGGMPFYKYIANRFLTLWENIMSGQNLSEWHTGMRAYRRKVLETIDFRKFSDDFIFDTQMLFKVVECGFLIGDIPVPVRYFKEASSINFKRSLRYGLLTIWESLKHLKRRLRGDVK